MIENEKYGCAPVRDSYFDVQCRNLLEATKFEVVTDDKPTECLPQDMYDLFEREPKFCEDMFGITHVSQVDQIVMEVYVRDVWPERLKEINHE